MGQVASANEEAIRAWDGPLFERFERFKGLLTGGLGVHGEEALRLFEQASTKSPSLPTAWHYLGIAYDRRGDSAQALEAWRKALNLQPDYPQTHTALGLMYARAGDMPKAETEFRECVGWFGSWVSCSLSEPWCFWLASPPSRG